MDTIPYDCILLVSYGGPDGPEDVIPFIENILHGRKLSPQRLEELAEPYMYFGGASPINEQNRALLAAIIDELAAVSRDDCEANADRKALDMPVYWANLHWHPLLPDVLQQMADDGLSHALAFCTSAFGSYPGCRKYREAIDNARVKVGPEAPRVEKLRLFYNHPGFIASVTDRVVEALSRFDASSNEHLKILFTAHSLPESMAGTCPYVQQVRESCRLVIEQLQANEQLAPAQRESLADWELAYQSRSGPPSQPWLGLDVGEWLVENYIDANTKDTKSVVIVPIGFMSDHKEVIFDLDVEVQALCEHLGVKMFRVPTPGTHPRFVRMIRELIEERLDPSKPRLALGDDGPWADECANDCCPGTARRKE